MKPIELLVEAINVTLKDGDAIFALSAPISVPVIRPDHTYRTVPMVGNEEFFLKSVRSGAGDRLIFEFTPVAAAAYTVAEFGEKIVFNAFGDSIYVPLLTAIGAKPVTPWAKARTAFLRDAVKKKMEAVEEEQRGTYEDNPVWGSF